MTNSEGRHPRVPGYDRFERIGSGGFSTVYRAYEAKFDRVVAIKFLNVAVSDPVAQRRFNRECQLMGRLGSHPHVLTVFASDVLDDDRPYIVMEYLEGGTSSEVAPLPEEDVLRTGVLVGSALASIHAAGVVHRDVKPHNVLLSAYGQPVLGDFGVSGVIQQDGAVSNPMALSPLYAAPEAFSGLPTAASDQYSLAATLYALLTDRSPVEGGPEEPLTQIMLRALEDAPAPLAPHIASPATWAVLERALHKDPDARFASVTDMVKALQDAQEARGLPVTAAVGGTLAAPGGPPPGAGARLPTHRPLGGEVAPPPVPPPAPPLTGDTRPAAWPDPVGTPPPAIGPQTPESSTETRPHRPSAAGTPPWGPVESGPTHDPDREDTGARRSPRRSSGVLLPVMVLLVVGIVLALVVTVLLQTDDPAVAPPTGPSTFGEGDLFAPDVVLELSEDEAEDSLLRWSEVAGDVTYVVYALTDEVPGTPMPQEPTTGSSTPVRPKPGVGTCYVVLAVAPGSEPPRDLAEVEHEIDPDACVDTTPAIVSGE